jgi:hypothetical protein
VRNELSTMDDYESTRREAVECSFCVKQQNQVASMTIGPGSVAICSECVQAIVDLGLDGVNPAGEPRPQAMD